MKRVIPSIDNRPIYVVIFFLLIVSHAHAKLRTDSVYPNVGKIGENLAVMLKGSGFDENTRISMSLDTGNRSKIIGSVNTPGYANDIKVIDEIAYVVDGVGFKVIDVSQPSAPEIIGSVDTPGNAVAVSVIGKVAYVADSESGVQVIDINQPSKPAIIGGVDTPGIAKDVAIISEIAYVADGESGIQVLDVSQPSSPFIIGSFYSYDLIENAISISIIGGIAYVADFERALHLIDISQPSAPVITGSFRMPNWIFDITVIGETAYVAVGINGIQLIDISQPSTPAIIGFVDTSGFADAVTVSGENAYVADGNNGIKVIDISQPSAPTIIGSIDTPGYTKNIIIVGENAYVADGNSGVQVIDIGHPSIPVIIGSVETPGFAVAVTVIGGIAYVADGSSGVQVIDISQPSSPVISKAVDTPGNAREITINDSIAYVADGDSGVQVIDISQPLAPVIIGAIDTPGDASAIAINSGFAYVADGEGGVQVLDINQPSAPVIIGSVATTGNARDISVIEKIAYVTEGSGGVQVIDISQPSAPTIIGSVDTPGFADDITVMEKIAFVADWSSGVQVIDVSQPSAPVIIGSVDTPGNAVAITIVGDTAYVADFWCGVQVIDIREPSSPVIIGAVDTPGDANSIAVMGATAYVAERDSGLTIVPLPLEIDPLTFRSESELTFTLPSPHVGGNYTIRAFNETESDEIAAAVTFAESEMIEELSTKKAIILAGGGPYEGNTLWNATRKCASYAYKSLLSQGYSKDNIQFLSPESAIDADGDFVFDVNGDATLNTLKAAVLEWAADASEVILFMSDHGGNGRFIVNGVNNPPEYLTAYELDCWLDSLQAVIPGRLILVYDACQSGSFLPYLTAIEGKERIVITSTQSDENAWFLNDGVLSFSWQFWSSVFLNANLYESFVNAKNMMQNDQTCLIDANGNGIGNEKEDQCIVRDILIGRGGIAASTPPYISKISDETILKNGNVAADIRAEGVGGLNAITRVWAVITQPNLSALSTEIPITELAQIDLTDADNDGVYEGAYEYFTYNGTYLINVYAEDSEGLISVPLQTAVHQTEGVSTEFESPQGIHVTEDLWIGAVIHTEDKGDIEGQWRLGGQDVTSRGDRVIWGYFYASPNDVSWGNADNPDLFVKIWMDVTGPVYVDYFHVSVPDITVYTDFDAGLSPAADQSHTATMSTRFVEHRHVNRQIEVTLQTEDGNKPASYTQTANPFGSQLTNGLRIGTMINTVEKGAIEGIWREGGRDTTARGDTVIWGHYYADPSLVNWGSPQNPDLFVKIWFDVSGMVNVDFFHVSVPNIEVYSELPADGTYDNSGTAVLGNRFIEHRYQWK